MPETTDRRVLITGAGVVSPLGRGLDAFWTALTSGRVADAARLPDYAPPANLDASARAGLGRASLLAVDAAIQAIEDAGLPIAVQTAPLIGVVFGSGEGEREKPVPGAPATSVARVLGVAGPALSLEGPGSGLAAVVEGFELLKRTATPVVVAGGVDVVAVPDGPFFAGRPFDASRSSFSLVEAACAFVLEDAEVAEGRDARVYANLLGGGMAFSRGTVMEPAPNYVDAARAMRAALMRAEVFQGEVETVFAAASGDPAADEAEGRGIKDLWGPNADRLTVTSIHGAAGHAPATSGLLSLAAALKSLDAGLVPATAGCTHPDASFATLDIVTGGPRSWRYNTALVNAISEACNVSVVLRKA
jgi:3-oxoacyl-[acyl-carrier-protein] synthase II